MVRAATQANHEVLPLTREELDIRDASAVEAAFVERFPHAVVNCAAWTDVDGAEDDPEGAEAVNGAGAGNVAAAAAALKVPVVYPSTDYVFDGTREEPYIESDETNPASAYGASKLSGELATAEVNPAHFIVRTSWLFGTSGRNFVETMLSLADELGEVLVVMDQIGCPTYTGHLAQAIVRLLDGDLYGIHHIAGSGEEVFLVRIRDRGVQAGGSRLPSDGRHHRHGPAQGARAPPTRCSAPSASTRSCCRIGTMAWPPTSPIAQGRRHEGAGRRRRRLHRLELRARSCSTATPATSVVVLDKLTYAGRVETIQDLIDGGRCEFVQADIADAEAVREALDGCDAIVNFAAESHVDRSIDEPGGFIQTDVYGTYVLLEQARQLGIERYLQVSTDEVYGSIEQGSFTEASPLDPSSPYSASKAGGDLLVGAYHHTYGIDARDLPRLEQLRAVPVPREADPALHPQRPARRSAAGLRRRHAGAQLAARLGSLRRHSESPCRGKGRPDLQHRRSRRASEHRGRSQDHRVHGRRRVADRVRDRPARARSPLLARPRSARSSSAGRRRSPSTPGFARPSAGTARTPGGGSRSAPATTRTTTSGSTASGSAPDLRIDHVILVAPDLDAAAERMLAEHGLASLPGGEHPGFGTGNRIVPLGDSYVELMGIVDRGLAEQNPLGQMVISEQRRWLGWCLRRRRHRGGRGRARSGRAGDVAPATRRQRAELADRRARRLAGRPTAAVLHQLGRPGRPPGARSAWSTGSSRPASRWLELSGDRRRIEQWLGGAELPLRFVDGDGGLEGVGIGSGSGEIALR